jgi:phosphoribosylamine--glycine ligase
MKFLMISQCGEGAGVLHQIHQEGNDCDLYIKDEGYKTVYDGLLEKTEEIKPDDDTIVIFDMSGNGEIADNLRKEGHLVYGASLFADDLEENRQFGLDTMKYVGIKIPLSEEFKDFNDALPFLEKYKDKKFVFKPSGDHLPCKLTYCSQDNEELLNYMKFVEEKFGSEIESFVLQEFVEGALVSSEIFFDGEKVVGIPNHTVEAKKFMNDDLGPSTGCSGNLVWLADDSKIVELGIMKMTELLAQEQFCGQIDLNAVVNKDGVYGLEFTPRFGFDATPTYLRMLGIEYGKFFSDIVNGTAKTWPHNYDEMWGMRVTIPPYPAEPEGDSEKLSPNEGIPIQNWETYNSNLFLYEVMMQDDALVHSGGTGVIACVIHKNPKRCYEILEKIKVPDKQYRTDLEKVLSKMKKEAELWQ